MEGDRAPDRPVGLHVPAVREGSPGARTPLAAQQTLLAALEAGERQVSLRAGLQYPARASFVPPAGLAGRARLRSGPTSPRSLRLVAARQKLAMMLRFHRGSHPAR
jgi:hypothetical protein